MRSRYSAFALQRVEYLLETMDPSAQGADSRQGLEWSVRSPRWRSLEVRAVEDGGLDDRVGRVEFVARYRLEGRVHELHEDSSFRRGADGRWLYVEGDVKHHGAVAPEPKPVGRNAPCPCDSGRKYKRCCGR